MVNAWEFKQTTDADLRQMLRADHRPLTHPAAIRRWAKANGVQIADRGRLPDVVRRAYLAAKGYAV